MKKNSITYSVIILTKNEELNIENCISSISNECEVVVLDSGSTDETKLISKNLGVKFFVNRQSGPFIISDQRNWGLKNCQLKNKWVLFLDADEEMSLNLHQEIIEKIKSNKFNAYKLTPKYMFWGKWLKLTQGYPNWHDRLLNKDEVWIEGGVWEHFNKQAKVDYIQIPYKHYANSKGFSDWLERHDRYSSWDAKSINDYLHYKS
ncbi:glycosyltransferase family 2 protein, partial [Flavobacteriaceae bacterium]|nr:glycosyltransferase family 2 protein [Flavobacteriaceae bacterium]